MNISASVRPAWLALIDNGDGTASLSGTPLNDDVGPNGVSLQVSDGISDTAQVFTITVGNTNDAPVFASTPTLTATEDSLYSYNVAAGDIDVGDVLSITAPVKPAWLALSDNGDGTAVLSGIPLNADVGAFSVTLQVSDGISNDLQVFTITVNNTNDTPLFSSSPVTEVLRNTLYSYNISTGDDDGDSVAITAPVKPAWLTLNDNGDGTATLSGIPTSSDVGAHSISLRVSDSISSSTQPFTLTVVGIGGAPTFSSIPVTTATEDLLYTYNISTVLSSLTRRFMAASELQIAALLKPAWLSLVDTGDGTATLSGTPGDTHIGSHAVILQVTDGSGAGDTQAFDVVVQNTNDLPLFTSSPVEEATEETLYHYEITATDDDAGENLIIAAIGKPAWLILVDHGDGTAALSGTPGNADVGDTSVYLAVTDSVSATATQNFSITVLNVNDTPIFSTTPLLNVNENAPYTYTVGASDPDVGDVLVIQAITLPVWLSFYDNRDGTALLYGTPDSTQLGSYALTLQVSDGTVTVDQTFTVQVNDVNDPPEFSDSPLTAVYQYLSYQYNIEAIDTDAGETLLIQATQKPAWLNFSQDAPGNSHSTAYLWGTPDIAHVGQYPIILQVTDNGGLVATQHFTVTVPNLPPVTMADWAQAFISQTTTLDVLLNDSDPDGNPISVLGISQPSNGVSAIDGGQVSYTPNAGFLGNDSFTYQLTDGLDSVEGQVRVRVVARNNAPRPVDDTVRATTGFPATLSVLTNDFDPDGNAMRVVAVESAGGSGSMMVASDGQDLRYIGADAGTQVFSYTVQDVGGDYPLSDSALVTVDVRDYSPDDIVLYNFFGLEDAHPSIRSGEQVQIGYHFVISNAGAYAAKAELRYTLGGANLEALDLFATSSQGSCTTHIGSSAVLNCDFGIIINQSAVTVDVVVTALPKTAGTLYEKAVLNSVNPIVSGGKSMQLDRTIAVESVGEIHQVQTSGGMIDIVADYSEALPGGKTKLYGMRMKIGNYFELRNAALTYDANGAVQTEGISSQLWFYPEYEPGGIKFLTGPFSIPDRNARTIIPGPDTTISTLGLGFPRDGFETVDITCLNFHMPLIKSTIQARFYISYDLRPLVPMELRQTATIQRVTIQGDPLIDFGNEGIMTLSLKGLELVKIRSNYSLMDSDAVLRINDIEDTSVPVKVRLYSWGTRDHLDIEPKADSITMATPAGDVTFYEPTFEDGRFYAANGAYNADGQPLDIEVNAQGWAVNGAVNPPTWDIISNHFAYKANAKQLRIRLPQNYNLLVDNFALGADAENNSFKLTVADRELELFNPQLIDGVLQAETAEMELPDAFDNLTLEVSDVWVGEAGECERELHSFNVKTNEICVGEIDEDDQEMVTMFGLLQTNITDIKFAALSSNSYKAKVYGSIQSFGVAPLNAATPIRVDLTENDTDVALEGLEFKFFFLEVNAASPFTFNGWDEIGIGSIAGSLNIPPTIKEDDDGSAIGFSGSNIYVKDGRWQNAEFGLQGFDLIPGFPLKEASFSLSTTPNNAYDIDIGATIKLGGGDKNGGGSSRRPSGGCGDEADVSADVHLRTRDAWFYGAGVGYECDYPLYPPNVVVLTGMSGDLDLRSDFVGPNEDKEVDSVKIEIAAGLAFGEMELGGNGFPIISADPTLTAILILATRAMEVQSTRVPRS
ncbi:MAG: tandem-95 repeat protein [Chloroflexi bacterium]|nr:tandem-95 repeat protein [Chloroflexota bacterium]